MSEDVVDELTPEQANALINVAKEVAGEVTTKAEAIAPDHIIHATLAIMEMAHGAVLSSVLLANHGLHADDEMEKLLRRAKRRLRGACTLFIEDTIEAIEKGEAPPEIMDCIPGGRPYD